MHPLLDKHAGKSEAEMKAHYKAVHQRIYGNPQREKEDQKKVIDNYLPPPPKGIAVHRIVEVVAKFYKTSVPELLVSHVPGMIKVRYIAMYLAYYSGKKNLRKVGLAMNFHLNTVCDGIRKITDRRKYDSVMVTQMNELEEIIKRLPPIGEPVAQS